MFETKIKKIVLAAALVLAAGACAVPSDSASDTQEKSEETKDAQEQKKSDETESKSAESKTKAAGDDEDVADDTKAQAESKNTTQEKSQDTSQADEDDSNELTGYTDNWKVIDAIIKETDGVTHLRNSSISFASGESTATVSDAVVRATANVHIFNVGKAGQDIKIDISSVENNAWFEVVTPSGEVWGDVSIDALIEFDEKSIEGDYAIIVTSQRGNATYDLTLEIE